MTDPVARSPSRRPETEGDEAVCREEARATSAPAKASAPPPAESTAATVTPDEMVAKLPERRLDLSKMAAKPTNSNAERTTARDGVVPYAAAGLTSSGDAVFAGAALLKGRNSSSGIEAEVLTASAQVGAQNEVQIGLLRVGASSDDGSSAATVDAFTARGAIGIHNVDGSTGLNVSLTLSALGVEATHVHEGQSATAAAALGVGADLSLGLRDADADGRAELCARVGAAFGTVGYCLERPW